MCMPACLSRFVSVDSCETVGAMSSAESCYRLSIFFLPMAMAFRFSGQFHGNLPAPVNG